jgi:hypothetical protein
MSNFSISLVLNTEKEKKDLKDDFQDLSGYLKEIERGIKRTLMRNF